MPSADVGVHGGCLVARLAEGVEPGLVERAGLGMCSRLPNRKRVEVGR